MLQAIYHFRNIAKVRPYLTLEDEQKMTCGFIFSPLCYYNALCSELLNKNFDKLQLIQNSAVRVLTDHITSVLTSH